MAYKYTFGQEIAKNYQAQKDREEKIAARKAMDKYRAQELAERVRSNQEKEALQRAVNDIRRIQADQEGTRIDAMYGPDGLEHQRVGLMQQQLDDEFFYKYWQHFGGFGPQKTMAGKVFDLQNIDPDTGLSLQQQSNIKAKEQEAELALKLERDAELKKLGPWMPWTMEGTGETKAMGFNESEVIESIEKELYGDNEKGTIGLVHAWGDYKDLPLTDSRRIAFGTSLQNIYRELLNKEYYGLGDNISGTEAETKKILNEVKTMLEGMGLDVPTEPSRKKSGTQHAPNDVPTEPSRKKYSSSGRMY